MKKFQNITESGNSKAVRLGSSVPSDAVNLAWFKSPPMTPSNTLSFIDMSKSISENVIQESIDGEALIAYPDSLGYLKSDKYGYNFPSNNITISNIPLNSEITTQNVENLNPNDFAHYFYTSRFFTPSQPNFRFLGLGQYLDPDSISDLNIKVVNQDGSEYVDPISARRKYRILLEKFVTDKNNSFLEVPHRIIVLLDADKPVDVRLIYNKVEADEDGIMFNQEIEYSETINPVPIYSEFPEDSYIVDPSYYKQRVYSIKKQEEKYSDILSGAPVKSGFQVLVNKKSIKDNRTYEVFNWRLIAKTRSSLNFDQVDYGQSGSVASKTVKAAVVASSSTYSLSVAASAKPYVFKRLQDSPFNLSKYTFVNPLYSGSSTENSAEYWMINLDEVSLSDLRDIDVLYFHVDKNISQSSAAKLIDYVQNNGVLIVDVDPSASTNVSVIDNSLQISSSLYSGEAISLNIANALLDGQKNGGWTINSDIFESENDGIHGTNYINKQSAYKSYPYFNSVEVTANRAATISVSGSDYPIAISLPRRSSLNDAVTTGLIVGTCFGLGDYVNNFIDLSDSDKINTNYNSYYTAFSNSSSILSSVQEGPFKFFYNAISYGLYLRAQASRKEETKSSIYNFVSKWKSSWCMESSVILASELDRYQEVSEENEPIIYAVNLTSGSDNIFNYYKSKISEYLSDFQSDRLSSISSSDIDFYIEVTNPDIQFKNATLVDDPLVDENVPSSYYLWKVSDPLKNGTFAFTQVFSPELIIPSSVGKYSMTNNLISTSDDIDLISDIDVSSGGFYQYPFSLESKYSYYQATDKPVEFSCDISGSAVLEVEGRYFVPEVVGVPGQWEPSAPEVIVSPPEPPKTAQSAVDSEILRATSSSEITNVFVYTGDIELGVPPVTIGVNNFWHRYSSYIQIFLKAYTMYKNSLGDSSTDYYPYKIDTLYGPASKAGIRKFQADANERWVDGLVDSETKSYMAKYWPLIKEELDKNNTWSQIQTWLSEYGVTDIYEAARDAVQISNLKTFNNSSYKKLSFTGTRGPKEVSDILYFEISESYSGYESYIVNKIIIEPDPVWNNFKIQNMGYSSTYKSNVFETTGIEVNQDATNGNIVITLNEPLDDVRHFWIQPVGRSLPEEFYRAEGFGIKNIKIESTVKKSVGETLVREPVEAVDEIDLPVKVLLDVEFSKSNISDISPDSNVTENFYPARMLTSGNTSAVVKRIRFYNPDTGLVEFDETENISSSTIRNSGSQGYIYTPGNSEKYSVNLKTLATDVSGVTFSLDKVFDIDGEEYYDSDVGGTSPVSFSYSGPASPTNAIQYTVTLSTNATYFSGSQVESVTNTISTNDYKLKSAVTGNIFEGRSTVNVLDGVLLLCDDNGDPVGIPSSADINSGLVIIDDVETDKRYGSFVVVNTTGSNDGLIYGFYDNSNSQKEFIGTKITYLDFVQRGVSNIYIGVCAIDADGNTMGNNEYLGPLVSQKFIPINIALKSVSPIFSVKINNQTSIKIGNMYSDLSKFDCWELPIYPGQFFKNINIPNDANYVDWKKNYSGQNVYCNYSVKDDILTNWSKIYGYGYYDVLNESPVIINDKKIKLRRTPLLMWNHPTTNEESIIGAVRPVVKIYTRETTSSDWVEVSYTRIRDLNSETGVISFKSRLVPSSPDLIKVDYTTKDKQIYIRQVEGNQIPLNPVLNSGDVMFTDPLYIYLLPSQVWKSTNVNDSNYYELITDYQYESSVNYTYDTRVFDKTSHLYNPFALVIGIVYVLRDPNSVPASIEDTRTRGGGLVDGYLNNSVYEQISGINSSWDVQPPSGHAYPNGGYVIIRIPQEVKNHFTRDYEIYNIISNNLTAGVAYELQDMEGNPWG